LVRGLVDALGFLVFGVGRKWAEGKSVFAYSGRKRSGEKAKNRRTEKFACYLFALFFLPE